MKKYILTLFLLLESVFMLTGCAGTSTADTGSRGRDVTLADTDSRETDVTLADTDSRETDVTLADTGSKETDDTLATAQEPQPESEYSSDLMDKNYRFADNMELPEYAKGFYQILEEGTDSDGNNDYLIEDRYFAAGSESPANMSELLSEDAKPYQIVHARDKVCMFLVQVPEEEGEAVCEQIRTVMDVFEADHPEVFWLCMGRELQFLLSPREGEDGNECSVFLFMKNYGDTPYDIRVDYTEQLIREDISRLNQSVETILADMPDGDVLEKVKYLNDWLTKHNDYNTIEPSDMHIRFGMQSISAIAGSTGEKGPECRGYAYAFKLLCDRAQIPCVTAVAKDPDAYYTWNYVQAGQLWYGVDITWNDPRAYDSENNRIVKEISGLEREEFLMCGTGTVCSDGRTFAESYHSADELLYALPPDMELSETEYSP